MKLSNKNIFIIVMCMVIALSGLVVLQTILLNTALKAEEDSFRHNVILALNNVVNNLINFEARNAILQISIDDSTLNGGRRVVKKTINFGNETHDTIIHHSIRNSNKEYNDSLGGVFKYTVKEFSEHETNYQIAMIFDDSLLTNKTQHGLMFSNDSIDFRYIDENDSARILVIEAALSQMKLMEQFPIEDRIDVSTLDSAIQKSFQDMNIDLKYSFGVTNRLIDSVIMSVRNPELEVLSNSPYKIVLFSDDFINTSNYLILDFPNKQFFIYSKLLSLILPTLFFLIIIISIFVYSINLILRQRKTSIRLTDFINNMTHEFKTPISTIQLASEAISKKEILKDSDKILSYNKMILSENNRMKSHVDKILQIATLEEGDYILSKELLSTHEIISDVVDSFQILLKQQNGRIEINLDADKFKISGDRVHIVNIIYNLLDNALKYSNDNPLIIVSTQNNSTDIEISIKDKGIGIHPDDIKFLFDKYYRVGNINVHNIKGFGLGLSYVKMMVEAHDGTVKLSSALDKGTEVVVTLPLM